MILKPICALLSAALLMAPAAQAENYSGLMGVESVAIDPKNAGNVYLMPGTDYLNGGESAIPRSRDYPRIRRA